MTFPVISVIVFTPLTAALIILLMPAEKKDLVRTIALVAAAFALSLSIWVFFGYDKHLEGYQFIEHYNWLPVFGISLYFGVDGMSAPLVLLTGVVMFTGVLISWEIIMNMFQPVFRIVRGNFLHFFLSLQAVCLVCLFR